MVYTVCYLGSTVFSTASLRNEINCRIGKAATTFGKLTKRAWQNKYVKEKTKVRIYQACVLSTLLYASEAWTTNTGQDKILNIKWQDRVSNYRVLEMAGLTSITTILSRRRRKWLGYVYRMDNTCILKKCLFGELSRGKRSQGRPKLHYKRRVQGHHEASTDPPKILGKNGIRSISMEDCSAHRSNPAGRDAEGRVGEKQDQRKQRVREMTAVSNFDTFTCCYSSPHCCSNSVRISHERSCSKKKLTSSKLL